MDENMIERPDDEFFFNVVEELGVLAMHESGWNREVNIVSWNGRPAKIDIRDWSPGHKRMSKGVTLRVDEALRMTQILIKRLDPSGKRRRNLPPVRPPQNRLDPIEQNQDLRQQQRPQPQQQTQYQQPQQAQPQFREQSQYQEQEQQTDSIEYAENDNMIMDSADMGAAGADNLWDEPADNESMDKPEADETFDEAQAAEINSLAA